MLKQEIDRLDPTRPWWVAAVVAPERGWLGNDACRRGARFLVDGAAFRPSRDRFETFESRSGCLAWIMRHRGRLTSALPGAEVKAVRLDRWLLGLE